MAVAVAKEDQIYEEIDAPKFVDFSKLDRNRPDDRSWFCTRIGCDQQHKEVDPDALHRSFILRVLAARSPNLRLKKAQSRTLKCPSTAPVKSVKDREPKSGGVVSIPERIKAHPISSLRTTPLAMTRKQAPVVTPKTLPTAPSKKRLPIGEEIHRFGWSPTVAASHATENVQDATTKTAGSQNLVTEMCHGMKKLHIDSNTKNKDLCRIAQIASNGSGLFLAKSNLHNGDDKKGGLMSSKSNDDPAAAKIHGKSSDRVSPSDLRQGHLNDASSKSEKTTMGENAYDGLEHEKDEVLARRINSLSHGSEKENVSTKAEPKTKARHSHRLKGCRVCRDEKENFSATGLSLTQGNADHGHARKVVDKLKATNPKPFRFRTDERGILKEANLEKKLLHLDTSRENKTACAKYEKKALLVNEQLQSGIRNHLEEKATPSTSNKTPNNKAIIINTPSRLRRPPATIPRGPVFHRINVPKGCTKRLLESSGFKR